MTEILFGIDTFGEIAYEADRETPMTAEDSLQLVVDEGVLADQLGIDVIALGEHHREEYAISAPEIVLAAMSQVTENIKLGTGVTVLSSDDPVRVFQRFATLDALSNGRAEVMLGRGSFTESFPLFGYDLRDYNELFEEKMDMFMEIRKQKPMNWEGSFTQSLDNVQIYPKIENTLDVIVGVGGTPESVVRVARHGLPMMLAVIGGEHARFKPYIDLYERASQQFGHTPQPVGLHSHGLIAEDRDEALDLAFSYYKKSFDVLGQERGWRPMTYDHFLHEVDQGAYFVGDPESVAQKLASVIKDLGIGRFDLIYSMGGQTADIRRRTIQLYGEVVIPRVKELLNG